MKRALIRGLMPLLLLIITGTPALALEGGGVELPEDKQALAGYLTDGNILTRVPLRAADRLSVRLDGAAQGIALKWLDAAAAYRLIQYDAKGVELSNESSEGGLLNRYHPLLPDCRRVTVEPAADCALCEAAWYALDEALPAQVQRWEPSEDRVDLMIVAAAPGEELWMLGGLLPQYAIEHEVDTAVAYLCCEKRSYAEEALDALWRLGIRRYPLFLNQPLRNPEAENIVAEDWGGGNRLRDALIGLIRQWRPRVLVTGGFGPEASQAARFAADALTQAAELAIQGDCAYGSTAYGLWQADKVYVQGEGDAAGALTTLDWSRPLYGAEGRTAQECARAAYASYRTQALYAREIAADGGFTLTFSTVGDDNARDSLFENIEPASLLHYAEPTPIPTPTPVPTPAPTGTPIAEAPKDEAVSVFPGWLAPAVLAAGLIAGAVLAAALYRWAVKSGRRRSVMALGLIPPALALGALVLWRLSAARGTDLPDVSPSPSASAFAASSPSPAPTPIPTPTPVPTPASSWPGVFREDGEEEIAADTENGRWTYRDDSLAIFIERRAGEPEGVIVTYFVAHIYMRDVLQFRPLFGSPARNGHGSLPPWIMARRAGAVLMISGDNMINMERNQKGIIIRDGRVFSEREAEATVALYPDMSLRIYAPREITAGELLCAGVENTFSFGPTLIRDGAINESAQQHRVGPRNPRVGIGMVEPGHLVAIVVDGRDRHYSLGISLKGLAGLFAAEGCTQAYNLDGGASTAILFMGEQINYHANNTRDAQRPVPDGLAWGFSRQVPTEFDPVDNKGQRK